MEGGLLHSPFSICSILFFTPALNPLLSIEGGDGGGVKADGENDGLLLVRDKWESLTLRSCSRTRGQDFVKRARWNGEGR